MTRRYVLNRRGDRFWTEEDGTALTPCVYVANDEPIAVSVVGSATGGLTDDELRAVAVHVVVDSMPAGGASLTDDELRATPVPVSGAFYPVTQPVSGTVTVNVGLTDTQIRATPLPVSGTFWQATQPVSGNVAVSGSVAVTGSFYQATQPVSIASMPSTPVTGTFWQATQPVSGPLTDTQIRATALPVSGTFWQATQPVSAAALPLPTGASTEATLALIKAKTDNIDVALSTRAVTGLTDTQLRATPVPVSGTIAVTGTFWQATQPVSGTVAVTGTFWQATQPVSAASLPLPTGASTEATLSTLNGKVTACNTGAVTVSAITPPTLTKATQGSTGFSVQSLIDAGRVYVCFTATAIATVTSEALVTMTPYRDLVAGSPATTFAVTSNKRLRLQSIIVTARATSTVNVGGIVRLRFLAGTVLVGSPIHAALGAMSSNLATAVVGNAMTAFIDLPDGLELSGTMQLGLTQLFSATTATIDVQLIGFEY